MQQRRALKCACGAICGAMVLSAAGAAAAGVITATYTGVVTDGPTISGFSGHGGTDYFGLFSPVGTNLVGTPFSVVYTIDESTPGSVPFFFPSDYSGISGASTAVLTINGDTFSFADPSFRITFTPPHNGGWGVRDFSGAGNSEFQFAVDTGLFSATDAFVPSYVYNAPLSHVAQSDDSSMASLFWMFNTGQQRYVEELPFSVATVDVTVEGEVIAPFPPPPPPPGVPEPASWALMLLGFASLGAVMRAHRKAAPAAV